MMFRRSIIVACILLAFVLAGCEPAEQKEPSEPKILSKHNGCTLYGQWIYYSGDLGKWVTWADCREVELCTSEQ